jgi:microcystin-dependent protein
LDGFFIAQVTPWAATFAPRNWALCSGALLPIASYTALFSLVGTFYGGDGRTTFGLPDLRGRVPIGPGTGPGLATRNLGSKGGSETVTLTTAQLPAHGHGLSLTLEASDASADDPSPGPGVRFARGNAAFGDVNLYSGDAPDTGIPVLGGLDALATGGGQAHPNVQPSLVLRYLIALQGIFPSRN